MTCEFLERIGGFADEGELKAEVRKEKDGSSSIFSSAACGSRSRPS